MVQSAVVSTWTAILPIIGWRRLNIHEWEPDVGGNRQMMLRFSCRQRKQRFLLLHLKSAPRFREQSSGEVMGLTTRNRPLLSQSEHERVSAVI